VGVIGAGPGGLAAAARLRAKGYQVTVYDRYDRSGGLLIYGIPNFKLEKDVVARRNQWLADSGVKFTLNFEVGRDATFEELHKRHDAILVATGVYKARDIQVPGIGLDNVMPAMRYLTASNRKGLGDAVSEFDSGALNAAGKDVVVVGGGDTAMDCVRTAVRQGAKSVTCLYRRNRANMPGSMREVANAEEEGVIFEWLAAPEAFLGDVRGGDAPGGVTGVRAHRMRLGTADASGRQAPEPIPGSTFTCPADLVITALGFDPEDLPTLFGAPDLPVTRWGTIKVNWNTMMTAMDGVFAVGDIVRGASLVVWAIRDGQDAAASVHKYLQAKAAGATSATAIAAE
jgi:glutamate synthase (NADPH/NADH) small chain